MNTQRLLSKARGYDALTSIFTLVLGGGEAGRLEAAELIRKLSTEQRRDLRAALQETDHLLDTVILSEMAERRPWKL